MLCLCTEEDAPYLQRRWRWLRELGLVNSSVVFLLGCNELEEGERGEWVGCDAAGNGDPSRDHRRGGVSKL